MICNVNVMPVKACPAFSYETGYVAIAADMPVCWSHDETIDATIDKFKKEYGPMMQLEFQNGEKIEFDFHVKLKA